MTVPSHLRELDEISNRTNERLAWPPYRVKFDSYNTCFHIFMRCLVIVLRIMIMFYICCLCYNPSFIHSFITEIYIAPLQGHYSEALPTLARLKRRVLRLECNNRHRRCLNVNTPYFTLL